MNTADLGAEPTQTHDYPGDAPIHTPGRRSGRAGIFTGRGVASRPHGMLISYAPAPPPDPATLAALPVGRRFLTATNTVSFRDALSDLATAWRAAGFGDATDGPVDLGTCPAADNTPTGDFTDRSYTFDTGQVLYYARVPGTFDAQWHTVAITDLADGDSTVALTPAARAYGDRYADTAAVDLPQLAVWLLAELTHHTRAKAVPAWKQARFAAAVNVARNEIHLYAHGIDDLHCASTEEDRAAFGELVASTQAHNWINPHDLGDRRFHLYTRVVTEHDSATLGGRGRLPGTVSVVDDPGAFWA